MSTLICNSPFSVETIDLDECVGLSLPKINRNFENLSKENCLTEQELTFIQNDLVELSAKFMQLSAFKFNNTYPKAWVTFNGKLSSPEILSVYNIQGFDTVTGIDKYGPGSYGLQLNANFQNANYALIGTAKEVSATPCFVQYSPTTPFTPTSANINITTPTGQFVDSEYVSIAIYNE